MIGSPRYPPRNRALVRVQHELYWDLVGYLYSYARERYLRAAKFVGVETELLKKVREKDNFDHRVLQLAHDEIAGYYDHKFNTAQMPLVDDVSYEERLRSDWCKFFHQEACELAETDSIALAILTAIAFENTDQGRDAEGFLLTRVRERYTVHVDS